MPFVHHIDKEDAEAIRTACENKDYDTWKNLVTAREEKLPEGAKSLLKRLTLKKNLKNFLIKCEEWLKKKKLEFPREEGFKRKTSSPMDLSRAGKKPIVARTGKKYRGKSLTTSPRTQKKNRFP